MDKKQEFEEDIICTSAYSIEDGGEEGNGE